MIDRARRFFALPQNERRMALEAALTLTFVSAALKTLPFAAAMRIFGLRNDEGAGARPADPARARNVGRAVARAARHLPFKPVCLPQATAAAMMLRRRGLAAEVRFGVTKQNGVVTAHAWSRCGETTVPDGARRTEFVPIAVFRA